MHNSWNLNFSHGNNARQACSASDNGKKSTDQHLFALHRIVKCEKEEDKKNFIHHRYVTFHLYFEKIPFGVYDGKEESKKDDLIFVIMEKNNLCNRLRSARDMYGMTQTLRYNIERLSKHDPSFLQLDGDVCCVIL